MNESLGMSVLDSLAESIAVLDQQGVIVAVNQAWRQFAWLNGCTRQADAPIGTNYLSVCAQAAGAENGAEGPIAADGIRDVIERRRTEFTLEYACHSPQEQRWFRMTVTRLRGSASQVVVTHLNISQRKRTEIAAKLAHALLRQAAEEDQLTGLPNRMMLMQRLHQLADRGRTEPAFCFALLFVDLDRFELINETLGHDAGDEMLACLGQRLRSALPAAAGAADDAGSLVARFDGHKFAYVACGIEGVGEASDIAERLRVKLSAPYMVKGQDLLSGISIGIAMGDFTAGGPNELIRNADIALNEAKQAGVGSTIMFDQTMHDRLSRRLHIEVALRQALRRRQFTVVYQPIVDLDTGRMISVEALLRWKHPQLGIVSPNEFIPIAEETGLIVPIGEWVLRESCIQWARWRLRHPDTAPAAINVNLSRVQIALGNRLLLTVRSALEVARMPASALQLEITEREVMKDPRGARELIFGLRDLGVRLAMDDFGTGTSSLGCLREYPFDSIKIDKTFVTNIGRDPHVLAVSYATINVIENLGMVSVAEGIEEAQVLAMLQAMGCRCGQGYLFSQPMRADKLMQTMLGCPSGSLS
jgi:diguanylate cyclase (GGDEF)-like protein